MELCHPWWCRCYNPHRDPPGESIVTESSRGVTPWRFQAQSGVPTPTVAKGKVDYTQVSFDLTGCPLVVRNPLYGSSMIILKNNFYCFFWYLTFKVTRKVKQKSWIPMSSFVREKLWDPAYLLTFVVESYVRLVWVLPPPSSSDH